ncbi:MAG: zinc ribbon domain-containing protein [Opitutaceae bacterium]
MLPPELEKLLILQDRDTKRVALENQLKAIPEEVASVERTITAEKGALDGARAEWRELESRKKLLETEIGSAEQKLGTYRTQQLGVRKNDEYQALGHQIQTMQGEIGDLEGRELQVMYDIDEARKRLSSAEKAINQNVAGHESRIRNCRARAVSLTEELTVARVEVEKARAEVPATALQIYDRRAARSLPAVVPVRSAKCGGCHLKVSSEAESAARALSAGTGKDLPTCDQCGRIIYWERE